MDLGCSWGSECSDELYGRNACEVSMDDGTATKKEKEKKEVDYIQFPTHLKSASIYLNGGGHSMQYM